MVNLLVGTLVLAYLPSALAFFNTSPFLLATSADLNINAHDAQIAHSSKITKHVFDVLDGCPARYYFLVRQQGVSSTDFEDSSTRSLSSFVDDSSELLATQKTMVVNEVVGNIDIDGIREHLVTRCGGKASIQQGPGYKSIDEALSTQEDSPYIFQIDLAVPSGRDYDMTVEEYNHFLRSTLKDFANHRSYMFIYTTTPPKDHRAEASQHQYEMEDPYREAVQMELKRDLTTHGRAADDTNEEDEGGLFERYQYLTPGLFMGISATIPLFLILVVGVKCLASLEVSYFAFSKEMGPAAQRK